MQQLKNINKTDKHIHTHKKRYLEVISRSTRFKEFNREKKTATKTSNMFKIVQRIGTCDTGFSSSNCLNLVKRLITSRYLFLCFSAVALSLNFTHHDVFFFVQYCLFTINGVFLLFNKV